MIYCGECITNLQCGIPSHDEKGFFLENLHIFNLIKWNVFMACSDPRKKNNYIGESILRDGSSTKETGVCKTQRIHCIGWGSQMILHIPH